MTMDEFITKLTSLLWYVPYIRCSWRNDWNSTTQKPWTKSFRRHGSAINKINQRVIRTKSGLIKKETNLFLATRGIRAPTTKAYIKVKLIEMWINPDLKYLVKLGRMNRLAEMKQNLLIDHLYNVGDAEACIMSKTVPTATEQIRSHKFKRHI